MTRKLKPSQFEDMCLKPAFEKCVSGEKKIDDHIKTIIFFNNLFKKEDDFYYKAYMGDEVERLIKTIKKWKPSLLKSIKNFQKNPQNIAPKKLSISRTTKKK